MQGLIARLLVWVLLFAGGAAVGVGLEHRPEQSGLIARFTGQGLAVQRDRWRDLALANKLAADSWKAALDRCEADRKRLADNAKSDTETTSAAADTRGGAAFDNGYAAGRLAGRKTCGAPTHADTPASGPGGAPGSGADGLRHDLAEAFNAGAYRPR